MGLKGLLDDINIPYVEGAEIKNMGAGSNGLNFLLPHAIRRAVKRSEERIVRLWGETELPTGRVRLETSYDKELKNGTADFRYYTERPITEELMPGEEVTEYNGHHIFTKRIHYRKVSRMHNELDYLCLKL